MERQIADTVADRVADLTALLQWQIVHNGHVQRWGERNPGLWWCMDCHTFAPTQFDGPEIDPECICGEINARHCPVHNDGDADAG